MWQKFKILILLALLFFILIFIAKSALLKSNYKVSGETRIVNRFDLANPSIRDQNNYFLEMTSVMIYKDSASIMRFNSESTSGQMLHEYMHGMKVRFPFIRDIPIAAAIEYSKDYLSNSLENRNIKRIITKKLKEIEAKNRYKIVDNFTIFQILDSLCNIDFSKGESTENYEISGIIAAYSIYLMQDNFNNIFIFLMALSFNIPSELSYYCSQNGWIKGLSWVLAIKDEVNLYLEQLLGASDFINDNILAAIHKYIGQRYKDDQDKKEYFLKITDHFINKFKKPKPWEIDFLGVDYRIEYTDETFNGIPSIVNWEMIPSLRVNILTELGKEENINDNLLTYIKQKHKMILGRITNLKVVDDSISIIKEVSKERDKLVDGIIYIQFSDILLYEAELRVKLSGEKIDAAIITINRRCNYNLVILQLLARTLGGVLVWNDGTIPKNIIPLYSNPLPRPKSYFDNLAYKHFLGKDFTNKLINNKIYDFINEDDPPFFFF